MPVQAPDDKIGSFYLGAAYDLDGAARKDDAPIMYDSRDLVTHAVVVGMTGSGKTGLCVGLLEEAALDKVPALIIDPKGDMTNLLLQFSDLAPEKFRQWVNQGDAERKGKTVDEFAQSTAQQWSEGLGDWGIGGERIQKTLDTVNYTIFTPGSDAGIPVNILGSLAAPQLDWAVEGEAIRERIGGTVAALMGLAGIKADTVRSREAVLLASIFEHYWRQNQNLTLEQLILAIQTPPVKTVGVFDVDTFYPPKDRFDMAMAFNNLVAAPTFQSWLTGEPLDIQTLMFTPDGKPRHSIFYIAHLSDSERMFFVTLLLENLVTWMRRQSGTTTLSALVYFDEIFGYFPPTAEPPSKRPLLTLMKQARAFGLGVVLVTQNPVDLDYKGLTNAGTWLIGKLQAERDKARVLEGLKGALSEAGAEDKTNYDMLIPKLGSRVFLMHNVNARGPQVFTTRWAQSYLRGPLTKTQVRELMKDRKPQVTFESEAGGPDQVTINPPQPDVAQTAAFASTATAPTPLATPASNVPPGLLASAPITDKVEQAYLPVALDASQAARKLSEASQMQVNPSRTYLVYRANVLGVAMVSYQDKKRGVEHREDRVLLAPIEDSVGRVDWAAGEALDLRPRDLRRQPEIGAPDAGPYFEPLPESANTATELKKISSDLEDWLYYNARVKVKTQADLGVTQGPGESDDAFLTRVKRAADEAYNADLAKSKESMQKKEVALADKLKKAQQELADDQAKVNAKRIDQVTSLGEGIFNFFFGRRSSSVISQAMRKQNQAAAAGAEVEKSKLLIADLTAQQAQLDADTLAQAEAIATKWKELGAQISEVDVAPRRTDVAVDLLAVGWTPEWVIEYDDNGFTRSRRVPAHVTNSA